MFTNRTEAGKRLAERLQEAAVNPDLVLAIPRGGLPVGRAVADALGVPLDVVVASKVGAPGNPELAIGAVTGEGDLWLNDSLVEQFGIGDRYIESQREREANVAREKVRAYRGGKPVPDVSGKRVVIVDDGVATGATALACLQQVRSGGAARIVFAVPVASAATIPRLREVADDVVVVEVPETFAAVGYHYRDFGQVTDEEALEYLDDEV
ncbi:phosphoribosyltransferase [Halogeometricum borinquense]|uniref:Phosphoribosyltransferase n=1 Tax=Halogeometricum borinquense TaxID=60847 RepID=A0A482TAW9_9EURY|nr:phosphoribosyltransferase family protein [Halogeometricum borinquense]RYJ15084.1 phosphoribosyltransferase [Halogeometricum borinquense]